MSTVRTRIAPSPTGFAHIGTLRGALYNYLYAKKTGGKFVLRIEDTDQNRLVDGALEDVVKMMHDFNIEADEGPFWNNGKVEERGDKGPYQQSQRLGIYKEHADKLIVSKHAYYCFCTPERLAELRKSQEAQKLPPKYDKHCLNLSAEEVQAKLSGNQPHVIRLNVPSNEKISFEDVVHGPIEISSNDIDDQVLLKSDGFPTYHLAVVVDDHFMEITHVIRGDEWIPSTPKHVLLYRAFGWELPVFVHLPLLLSKTHKKLSKREGDVAVKDFIAQGYLPEALLNFVAFLGWNPKTEQEIFDLRNLVEYFDLDKINKAGAVFDVDKLDWINGMYIRQMKDEALLEKLIPYLRGEGIEPGKYPKDFMLKIIKLEKERLKKLSEIGERIKYFFGEPAYDKQLLVWKKSTAEDAQVKLSMLMSQFSTMEDVVLKNAKELENVLKAYIAENNFDTGSVLWPLRVALTGMEKSPGPFEVIETLSALPNGKEIIQQRIETAISLLAK